MKFSPIFTAITVASSLAMSAVVFAQDINTNQKSQIEGIVHDYIVKNPEVIAEAAQSLQQKQMDQMKTKGQEVAAKKAGALFNDSKDPVGGNANGKVTLVEFFDYQCPHCVDMDPDVKGLIKANPELRVVFKEFPIRGPMSITASKAALAANMQGKYMEMHDELMKNAKDLTEAKINEIAKQIGLNMSKFKADMASSAVDDQIKGTYKLAQELQLYGTPALFVAKTSVGKTTPSATAINFIPGQVDQKYLQDAVNKS